MKQPRSVGINDGLVLRGSQSDILRDINIFNCRRSNAPIMFPVMTQQDFLFKSTAEGACAVIYHVNQSALGGSVFIISLHH